MAWQKLYSKMPEYVALCEIHADFHICADGILADHNNGNANVAVNKLGGEFKDLSNQIQLELVRLFTSAR